jgi:hypothetical protein
VYFWCPHSAPCQLSALKEMRCTWWNSSFYNKGLYWDIYSSFTSNFQSKFINRVISLIMVAGVRYSCISVTSYKSISILNNFSKICENIIHLLLSFSFKFKLHLIQHHFYWMKIYGTQFSYITNVALLFTGTVFICLFLSLPGQALTHTW